MGLSQGRSPVTQPRAWAELSGPSMVREARLNCLLGCIFFHGIFTASSASSNRVNMSTTETESRVTQKLPGPAMLSVSIQLKHWLRELRVAPENEFSAANPKSFIIFCPASPHTESFKHQDDWMMQKKFAWSHQEPGVAAEECLGTAWAALPPEILGEGDMLASEEVCLQRWRAVAGKGLKFAA